MEVQGMNLPTLVSEIRKYQREMPIILNSSFGSKKIDECKQFNAFLSKPIKPSSLYESLGRIFDNEAIVERSSLSPRHEHDNVHKLRILLAEDNVINQKVALRMLKKIGYRADLAANGLEVLQALERLHYDVVLMDVQMPEMDGLEATSPMKRLPLKISLDHSHHHMLLETTRKCLKAGMDGYASLCVNEPEDASNVLLPSS
jgi:CheY-like chemotaxis protein